MEKILEVSNLSKHFPTFNLENISFDMEFGTIMGFIGRNGAGKTTTMKSIINIYHPDSGCVKIFGKDFKNSELEIKEQIAFSLSGVEYFQTKKLKTITSVTKRFYKEFDTNRYEYYLKLFGIDENVYMKQLSNGMKVKYSLAIALSHDARLFILDEPTSGLDPISRDEILEIFLGLVKDKKRSILFSTHITSDLDKCATNITYIKKGKMIGSNKKDAFIDSYRLVKGDIDKFSDLQISKMISSKKDDKSLSGLIKKEDILSFDGMNVLSVDLETIMIYEEREHNYEESII